MQRDDVSLTQELFKRYGAAPIGLNTSSVHIGVGDQHTGAQFQGTLGNQTTNATEADHAKELRAKFWTLEQHVWMRTSAIAVRPNDICPLFQAWLPFLS